MGFKLMMLSFKIYVLFCSGHRRTIARNHALLAMYTNQVDLCRTLIKDWVTKYPDVSKEEQDLILAGVLSRSGRSEEAVELLLASSQR